jgi:hypothetical protein
MFAARSYYPLEDHILLTPYLVSRTLFFIVGKINSNDPIFYKISFFASSNEKRRSCYEAMRIYLAPWLVPLSKWMSPLIAAGRYEMRLRET